MTGSDLKGIRHQLGLSTVELGRALGYQGTDKSVETIIRRFEAPNGREIPVWIERLAMMYDRFGVLGELT